MHVRENCTIATMVQQGLWQDVPDAQMFNADWTGRAPDNRS
jgi:hypothetical protein